MSAFVTVLVEGLSPMDAEMWVGDALGRTHLPGDPKCRVVSSRGTDAPSTSAALRDLRKGLSDIDDGLRKLKRHL